MDHHLDLLATPGASRFKFKDRDDLDQAMELGLRSQEETQAVEGAADDAIRYLRRDGLALHWLWSAWRPDPAWKVPCVP